MVHWKNFFSLQPYTTAFEHRGLRQANRPVTDCSSRAAVLRSQQTPNAQGADSRIGFLTSLFLLHMRLFRVRLGSEHNQPTIRFGNQSDLRFIFTVDRLREPTAGQAAIRFPARSAANLCGFFNRLRSALQLCSPLPKRPLAILLADHFSSPKTKRSHSDDILLD